ncbi:G-protein coupled receptor 183-A-like [Patella vulgata]|uniref:G-protein coupled receptor 183-A-like n=1 Tax=Patella vulgata TaxID=6465 RepID=UPI0024A817E6|nr:G-protein coupled receptor 183-A-like [Patella vulgata]
MRPVTSKLIPYVENVVGNASAMTILAISIERYRLAHNTNQHNIVFITSVFFFLPLIAIIILYARVCRKLVILYEKERVKFETSPIEIIKLKRQMIQIIVTVVLVFFVCHTPYRAIVLWALFEKKENLRNFGFEAYLTVLYLTRILLYANHAINPFVNND